MKPVSLLALLAGSAVAASCSPADVPGTVDGGDAGTPDVGVDGAFASDGGKDSASSEGGSDAGPDATPDATSEAGSDAPTCDAGFVVCSACVDPSTDRHYCGASGNCQGLNAGTMCPSDTACESGACVCTPGLLECGGSCIDPLTNSPYCGASGNCQGASAGTTCPSGTACSGGICVCILECGGSCIDPLTSSQYCGATSPCTGPNAGVSCPSGELCSGGSCGAASCAPGGAGLGNCGAGSESCCTSLEVAGGTYDRTYANSGNGATGLADPATVSSFRLDKYLVTVGRFRQFVTAWNGGAGYTPPMGSGKHTHLNGGLGLADSGNPGSYEPGWVTSDDSHLALTDPNLTCAPVSIPQPPIDPNATWTTSAGNNETLPMNCVNWWESYAFCIWDGGFLPSEAEWEYAAAAGSQQREYPWGSTPPGLVLGTALDAGYWGQLDLEGEFQWNLDWYATYAPCIDCAYLTVADPPQSDRVMRGGGGTPAELLPAYRSLSYPGPIGSDAVGLRCARAPSASPTCVPGRIVCNATCVDPSTDLHYCGASGNCQGLNAGASCPSGMACESGACVCTPGLIECGGSCIDPMTSSQYCGATSSCTGPNAGVNCALGEGCSGGICGFASCAPGGPGLSNCGASSESCCTSLEVAGGTYDRTYTNPGSGATGLADPATVSGFRLDKYLVTVGRYRQFVTAWNGGAGYTPPMGSGKHTHLNGGLGLADSGNPGSYEPGWVTSDDSNLSGNLGCDGGSGTSPGNSENLPVNCVNWWESYAFCIWDGGFLPTEAEWEYAAAAGSQQREYPWGSTPPGTASQYAIYGCDYPSGSATCTGDVTNVAPVGTATLGVGYFGQLDLAGEVYAWNLDWYAPYTACTDCAYASLWNATWRVARGSDFGAPPALLVPPYRNPPGLMPNQSLATVGFRCARTP
jgi:sulfatase modifying factor 1